MPHEAQIPPLFFDVRNLIEQYDDPISISNDGHDNTTQTLVPTSIFSKSGNVCPIDTTLFFCRLVNVATLDVVATFATFSTDPLHDGRVVVDLVDVLMEPSATSVKVWANVHWLMKTYESKDDVEYERGTIVADAPHATAAPGLGESMLAVFFSPPIFEGEGDAPDDG